MDGKMIREHIGVLTLTSHEDNAPQAHAIHDRKEGTKRCEMKVAQALLSAASGLEGKIITADALHCQRETAALIVGKGGDYILQIKENQPALFARAQARAGAAPFLRKATKVTDVWKPAL